jgi:hypothetical protein
MNWQQIRDQYAHRWIIIEATAAHTEGDQRILTRMEVVEVFADEWQPAWERYKSLHQADRVREYYVLHTDRPELNIGVLDTFGMSVKH